MDEVQWGDTRTLDKASNEMVPTIGAGTELDVELELSVPDLNTYGFEVYRQSDERVGALAPALQQLKAGLPLYRFAGIARSVKHSTRENSPTRESGTDSWIQVDMDCGLPVCLGGRLAAGDPLLDSERWRIAEGRWVEGITTLWANVAWQTSPWNWIVKVRVEDAEELGPVRLRGSSWWVPLLTVLVIGHPRHVSRAYLNEGRQRTDSSTARRGPEEPSGSS